MTDRSIEELEDDITQGAARMDAALCSWLLTLAEFDRRQGYGRWECRSAAHFLNWRCGISLRTARDQVRVARRLEDLPIVRAAFADGVLSYSKARAITRVVTPETEVQLVEWAQHATAAQLDRLVAGRRSVDRPEAEARYATWDDDGVFVLRARMSPEEGALVLAALQSARAALEVGKEKPKNGSAEPLLSDEPGSLRPTGVDAVVAMAETMLAHGPTPVSAGDRHMVLVHVQAETGEATLENGVVLSEASAQQVLCNASFATNRLGEEGEPLQMGRKTRDPTLAQRRALLVRDGAADSRAANSAPGSTPTTSSGGSSADAPTSRGHPTHGRTKVDPTERADRHRWGNRRTPHARHSGAALGRPPPQLRLGGGGSPTSGGAARDDWVLPGGGGWGPSSAGRRATARWCGRL